MSESHHNQAKLERELAMVHQAIENSLSAFDIIDDQGKFIYVNKAYVRLWGYKSAGEIIGTSPANHCQDPDVPNQIMTKVNEEGECEIEFKAKRKDGTTFDALMFTRKDLDAEGNVIYPSTSLDITARKAALLELDAQKKYIESIIQSIPGIFYIFDKDTARMVKRNDNWLAITGYTEAEIEQKTAPEFAGDPDHCIKKMQEVYQKGESTMENTLLTKSGEKIPYYFTGKRVDVEGKTYLVGVGVDISETHKAKLMLDNVLNAIPARVFWKDLDSVYLGCNQLFANDAGKKNPEELVGCTDFDLAWGEAEADLYRSDDKRVMQSGESKLNYEEPQTRPDGKYDWLNTSKSPIRNIDGQVIGILGTYEDITARKHAEEALRESEENLRTTLDSIGDAVIATDNHGLVTRLNPIAEQLTGWRSEEAINRPLEEIFHIVHAHTRKRADNPVTKVLETGEIVGLANHTMLIARNGEEYQIADSGAPIRNEAGQTQGVVLVFRDVTEEYKLQEQLHQSQKMEAVGLLAGGVAHDFNNMLAGIIGSAEILEGHFKHESNPEVREMLKVIMDAAEHAAGLTQKLLTFARKQPTSSTPVNLHRVLNNTVDILKNTVDRSIDIELNLEAPRQLVVGDPSQLQSAFINLGINGSHAIRDAQNGSGTISFATHQTYIDDDFCQKSSFKLEPGEHIVVEIRDSGSGIPPEEIEHIFDPFFTTKNQGEGTGLGLAAVYGTVQQHKGAITVDSAIGKGSSFTILLPLVEGEQFTEPKPAPMLHGSGHILVIDDEPVMRATVKAVLKDLGYDVTLAENGEEGIAYFKASPETYHLVLLDMIMPKMNGRECFKGLKKIQSDVCVVISSGFAQEDDLNDLKELGLSGMIRKPYRRATLAQTIHNALHKRKDKNA